MFDGGNPNFGLAGERLSQMMQSHIAGFGSAGGPDNIKRGATEESGQLLSRLRQRSVGPSTQAVRARRISREFLDRFEPGSLGDRMQGRRGVVIEVDQSTRIEPTVSVVGQGF
jgi:hypothetical protein